MATKKTTTKKTIKKTTTKAGPGRPRKNVIGGKKTTGGPGRPRKNVILTKEERLKNATKKTTTKKVGNKKNKIKNTTTKKPTTTNLKTTNLKTTNIKKKNRTFRYHKINKNQKGGKFAIYLLIFSFLLFSFSVYKVFFTDTNINKLNNTIQETTIPSKIITIESYEDVMGIQTTGSQKNKIIKNETGEHITEIETSITNDTNEDITLNNEVIKNISIPEIVISPHIFTRAFNKEEVNPNISILQNFLYKEMLYTGDFQGINNAQTRDAIYEFQLKYKILTPEDNTRLRGYFGPSTRAKVNALMPKE